MTTTSGGGGSWGVIADLPGDFPLSDRDIMDVDAAVDKKEKEQEKEIEREQQQQQQEQKKDYKAMRDFAMWRCHPRCGFETRRENLGASQNHQRVCDWQIEAEEKTAEEKELIADTRARMRYSIH